MTDHESHSTDSDAQFPTESRYDGFTTEDDYVLYDRHEETAWIQADAAVSLEEMV